MDFGAQLSATADMQFSKFFLEWPWIGLGFAVVLLILAFATDFLRQDTGRFRWIDPAWLAWIGAIAYMLHNMEEYGIAANGMFNAFPHFMTAALGFEVSEAAYLACNIGLVWICGPLCALLARKYEGLAPCMAIFELINGIAHVAQAIRFHLYNPGLLTAILLFIPLACWTIYVCFIKGRLRWSVFAGQFAVAFAYHTILMAGVFLAKEELIGALAQGTIMVADAVLMLGCWYLVATRIGEKRVVEDGKA